MPTDSRPVVYCKFEKISNDPRGDFFQVNQDAFNHSILSDPGLCLGKFDSQSAQLYHAQKVENKVCPVMHSLILRINP